VICSLSASISLFFFSFSLDWPGQLSTLQIVLFPFCRIGRMLTPPMWLDPRPFAFLLFSLVAGPLPVCVTVAVKFFFPPPFPSVCRLLKMRLTLLGTSPPSSPPFAQFCLLPPPEKSFSSILAPVDSLLGFFCPLSLAVFSLRIPSPCPQ